MLEKLKNTNKVIGTKQTKRAILADEVQVVYIAKDADTHVINGVIELCKDKGIEIVYVDSKKELGMACGIDVSAATAAILK